MKKKKIEKVKAWAVVWSQVKWLGSSRGKIVCDEFHDNHKNGPYQKPMVFTSRKDARQYAEQLADGDTFIYPCTITYEI